MPANARVIVDGTPTTSTAERRTLLTPALQVGETYVYTIRPKSSSMAKQRPNRNKSWFVAAKPPRSSSISRRKASRADNTSVDVSAR